MLSAVQWLWATGDFESVKVPLLHHKLEAYKYVGQQVTDPSTAMSESTVSTVATLALVEASMWQMTPGSLATIVAHFRGLQKIMGLRGKSSGGANLSLLQKMIRMCAISHCFSRSLMLMKSHAKGDEFYSVWGCRW